jgi:diadenylate cyclase
VQEIIWTLQTIDFAALLDILLVAATFFVLTLLLRGTQAVPLLRAIILLAIFVWIMTSLLELVAFSWVLRNSVAALAVALPVIFQPEIRRALDQVGRFVAQLFNPQRTAGERGHVIAEVCEACEKLSNRRHGALIVLQQETPLKEYADTGVYMDSEVTSDLLLTIFWPKTELHDGAVIISEGRAVAAACVMPLVSGRSLGDRQMGLRHRAGIGISEVSDAVGIIVSEETGQISVTNGGRIIRRLDANRLRTILKAFYGEEEDEDRSPLHAFIHRLSRWRERQRFEGD